MQDNDQQWFIQTQDTSFAVMNSINGLVQDCSNSSVFAMELLQSCTKPWSWHSKNDLIHIAQSLYGVIVWLNISVE